METFPESVDVAIRMIKGQAKVHCFPTGLFRDLETSSSSSWNETFKKFSQPRREDDWYLLPIVDDKEHWTLVVFERDAKDAILLAVGRQRAALSKTATAVV